MVEISGMEVVAWQPLLHEMPFTEWIGGCIDIRCTPDGMRAYKDGTLLKGTK